MKAVRGGGVVVVDWVYVSGVWSIAVLIYATVLNFRSHLVDGYGSVRQCMGCYRLVGGGTKRLVVCHIVTVFVHLLYSVRISAFSPPTMASRVAPD
jgi:hypothetical protein